MATGYRINKGLDRPPEVLGIRGMNYLMYLAGGVGGAMLVTALVVIVTGVAAMWGFIIFIGLVFTVFNYLVRESRKYGERGYARQQASNQMPPVILVRDTRFLTTMRKTGHRTSAMMGLYKRILNLSSN